MNQLQNPNQAPERGRRPEIDAAQDRSSVLRGFLANEQITAQRSLPKLFQGGFMKPIVQASAPMAEGSVELQSDAQRLASARAEAEQSFAPNPYPNSWFQDHKRVEQAGPDVVESHYQVAASPPVPGGQVVQEDKLAALGYKPLNSEPNFAQEQPYVTVQ